MAGPDDCEVPVVESGDLAHPEALSDGDHRGVSSAEREISISLNEVGHAVEVGGGQRDEGKDVVPDRTQEPGLRLRPALALIVPVYGSAMAEAGIWRASAMRLRAQRREVLPYIAASLRSDNGLPSSRLAW